MRIDAFVDAAVAEARQAISEGGMPFGAVLVVAGAIVSSGRNQMLKRNDPMSHAEIEAIRAAGLAADFTNSILYASAFPCLMCAAAMVYLKIPELVVGATWPGCESSLDLLRSNGVRVVILDDPACAELLGGAF